MSNIIEEDNIRPPEVSPDGEAVTLTTYSSRQGPKGKRVLVILVAALALAALAWVALQWGFSGPV